MLTAALFFQLLVSTTAMTTHSHIVSDTVINNVSITLDETYNTWRVSWLSSFQKIQVTVKRLDGKISVDQTFENTENGDINLVMLTPGFYTVRIQTDDNLPFHVYLMQEGFSRGMRDD